ncbi:MAG: hypothetical protein WCQ65_12015 [Fermentimonas sp.]
MKAFIAQNKYIKNGSSDYLVVASSKKAAFEVLLSQVREWGYNYLKKDVIEVTMTEFEPRSITIMPSENDVLEYPLSDYFDFDIYIRVDHPRFIHIQPENKIFAKDEKTTKELIKLFKNEYPSFFKKHF